jgi:hypothetical protein
MVTCSTLSSSGHSRVGGSQAGVLHEEGAAKEPELEICSCTAQPSWPLSRLVAALRSPQVTLRRSRRFFWIGIEREIGKGVCHGGG